MYRGYTGSMEISIEDNCLHGKIEMINDLVTYEAESPSELQYEFESAVDSYLDVCGELGKDPDKPFSGSFNIRIGSKMHKLAVIAARIENVSLNEYVKEAVRRRVREISDPHSEHVALSTKEADKVQRFSFQWPEESDNVHKIPEGALPWAHQKEN